MPDARRTRLMPKMLLAVLSAVAGPLPAAPAGAEGGEALRLRLEAMAGGPVRLDPRLVSPACPEPHGLAWRDTPGKSLVVSCPALGRRLVVPVASGPLPPGSRSPAPPLVRRGARVRVAVEGPAFRVSVEAVAETEGAAGERIVLRNSSSGQRFAGLVQADGEVVALPQRLP